MRRHRKTENRYCAFSNELGTILKGVRVDASAMVNYDKLYKGERPKNFF